MGSIIECILKANTNVWVFFLIVVVFILIITVGVSHIMIDLKLTQIIKLYNSYPTYQVNGGRDTMVRLPSGIGINSNLTRKEALELITNQKSGLAPHADEIMKYFERIDN